MTFEEIKEAVAALENRDGGYMDFRQFKGETPEIYIDAVVTLKNVDEFIAILQAMKQIGQAEAVGVET